MSTPGNDFIPLQATDSLFVGSGLGADRYLVSGLIAANQQITISDTSPGNTLQLAGGLVVSSARVFSDTLVLTLSNGAVITLTSASNFNFLIGGDPLLGTGGTSQTYATFVTTSLGIATGVPAVTATAPAVTSGAITVNAAGNTSAGGGVVVPPPAGLTFALTATSDSTANSINEGVSNTFTVTASAPVTVATTVTFQLATGTTQLADFGVGSFNVVTATIAVGQTTATAAFTAITNDGTELTETYTVTATVAGVTTPLTRTVSILDGGISGGQTFTLTTNVETVDGTSGNDTIIAGVGSANGDHTLGASDVINGNAGTDNIDIILVKHQLTPRLNSVEQVFAQSLDTTASLNMVNATGVTQLWSNNSTSNLDVTNLNEKVAIGVKGGVVAANYTVAAFTVAARTGDLAIVLDKAKVGNLTVNATGGPGVAGYTSTTINAVAGTGTDINTVTTLDVGNALATVKVTGDGALVVTNNLAATVRTIDASANKGGVNFNIATNTGSVTFTGGEGADRVNFGGTLNLNDKADGGAGRDILGLTDQNSVIAGVQVTNIEILELVNLTGTVNAALIVGLDEVRVTTTLFTGVVNGLTSNSTFVTNASGVATLNLNNAQVAGTADTLNLKTGITGGGVAIIMAAGVETIAYTQNNPAQAGANTSLNFFDTDGTVDMTTLTIANTAGNTVNALGLVNTIKTVDASAALGAVNLGVGQGNATNGVTLKGGAGADSITGGDGKDIITGGAGNDSLSGDQFTFTPGTGGAAIAQVSTLTVANAEVGDVFTIAGNNVTWTGVEATDNAAVIAAAAIAGVTVTADALAVVNAGTFTLTGANTGAAFALPTVASTNVAAKGEVSTLTVNNAAVYDAGDVVTVAINNGVSTANYSVTTTAGQTAASVATALAAQVNGGSAMTAVIGGVGGNVLTLTGANATTNYTITPSITNVGGGGGTQTAQVTTATLSGAADAGDGFSINVAGTVFTGATTAALAAAIGTAGGAIASATATSATVLTLTGLASGAAFTAAAGPTTNQAALADTVTVNFAQTAVWDAGDALSVTIDGTVVNTGALAGGNAASAAAAFQAAFFATGLPVAGYTLANNGAGLVTVSGPAVGTNIVITAQANTQAASQAQVSTIAYTDADWTTNGTTGFISATVNGTIFTAQVAVATEAGAEAAAVTLVNQINLTLGATVTAAAANGGANAAGLTITAVTAGTAFTATAGQAGAAGTAPTVTVTATTPNITTTANAAVYAVDNNTGRAAGTNDQVMTVATPTPGVTTTTVANAISTVVDNTFTAAGVANQTLVAATTTNGQSAVNQFFAGAATSDTLTGGDGNDFFILLSGSSILAGTMDTITDLNLGGASGVVGVDRIGVNKNVFGVFGPTDLINAGTALAMTGPTLAAAVQALFNAGGALNGSQNDVGLFTYSGDSYLVVTDNFIGLNLNDAIIKVTGVTGTLDLSDITLL